MMTIESGASAGAVFAAGSGFFSPTRTRSPSRMTFQDVTGFSAGGLRFSPSLKPKQAWCQGHRTVSPTRIPSASGPP